jgi:hypothetical protein
MSRARLERSHSASSHDWGAEDWQEALRQLALDLVKVAAFYDSLGGIIGYQLKCLELILAARVEEKSEDEPPGSAPDNPVNFLVPQGPNLQGPEGRQAAQQAAADGLRAMPQLAEIYPLGGVKIPRPATPSLPPSCRQRI